MKAVNVPCLSRAMTSSDIGAIVDIERASFPAPWPHSAFLSEIDNRYALNIVASSGDCLENNSVYAYSCNHVIENELSVLRMAVCPQRRRLGIGEHLLWTVLDQASQQGAEKAFLEVRPSNMKAISLYHKMGFRVIGTRPNYYPETGEDALVMMKTLKEKS